MSNDQELRKLRPRRGAPSHENEDAAKKPQTILPRPCPSTTSHGPENRPARGQQGRPEAPRKPPRAKSRRSVLYLKKEGAHAASAMTIREGLTRVRNKPLKDSERYIVGKQQIHRCGCAAAGAVDGDATTPRCKSSFPLISIKAARKHFREVHYAADEKQTDRIVRCRWIGCTKTLKFRDTGRHFSQHFGACYRCPNYPACRWGGSISRADALTRHMERCPVEREKRAAHLQADGPRDFEVSTPMPEQPEAGPSNPRKRSRSCVQDFEEEEYHDNSEQHWDPNDEYDEDYVPSKSVKKGKQHARKRRRD
ncbi:hypothetical protein DICSQDRAFT_182205 [Dichomitus squalens LYAD-421 SS1]|uniref:Uncharacterized protein n=1 Tax=Dichomitus squalens (strain LYAD-421) TaxID=732165 RepID=R7SSA4_DICSQ|nr:uncharacterized protein DICSQDRAFT_182205 [Dichomitus squalens LYAD-421 SS1]EJF58956.1 hypothetical protein DICSQDRAFT_182205 [Dichomitus squalens LYAD-421 SS1]